MSKKVNFEIDDSESYISVKVNMSAPRSKISYKNNDYRFYFKEMISKDTDYNSLTKLALCPISGLVMSLQGTEWYYEEKDVQEAYKNWVFEQQVLK